MKKLFGGLQTDYLDGFQYKFTYAWEDETGTMTTDGMKLRIIPTPEGYYEGLRNRYFYNYTDHLGNIRLSYSDVDANGEVTGDIVVNNCYDTPDGQVCNNYIIPGEAEGVTNYYPFGLMHNAQANDFNNAYQYKYNGKELQETGMYDYGARFYMPDIGRWGVVDNKAEKYLSYSSYNYVVNNPINAIDPDGNEIIFVRVIDENTQIQLQYKNGNFYYLNGDKQGKKYDGRKDHVSSNLFRLARAYRKIEKSNNDILKGMLHKLEKSDKKHYIFDPINDTDGSGVGGTPQGGSKAVYDFSRFQKELFEDMEGVPTSDFVEVVHEMRHQYDRDIDNISDSKGGADASNPMEQRAVKAENEARKLEGLPLRTTYGKEKVNPNPPNYKLPKDENKHK